MARKRIDETTRQQIAEAHEKGLSMREIAREFGVGSSSVGRIVMDYRQSKGKDTEKPEKTLAKNTKEIERQKKIKNIERRIAELEKKILELEAKRRRN